MIMVISMECISKRELEIIKRFRLLWNQHSGWTIMAVNAIVLNLPNEEETVNRLLKNPCDFGKTLSNFYGRRVGYRFMELLTEHLTLAADLIKANLACNTKEAEEICKKWYQNGNEIAKFLARINPFWSESKWRDMFFEHLKHVDDNAITLMNKEYQKNIESSDILEAQAMEMADMMSQGIIKQFCRKKR